MRAAVCAGAGFLLAVLWFDLMFDVQVVRQAEGDLPERVLASIAAYYRRVTTEANPMSRLVAAAMLATVGCLIAQAARADAARWVSVVSLAAAVVPISLAAGRTVPTAVRLGAREATSAEQSRMARAICRDHVFCFASILTLLVVQLAWA